MPNTPSAALFSSLFLAFLCLATLTRIVLARRQIAHVSRHRDRVPAQFAARISAAEHQKAADYTMAKTRFGLLSTLTEAGLLLALTLGGGLNALQSLVTASLSGLAGELALIAAVVLITSLIDLPFALFRQFVIEQRFGFNRMTFRLFLADLLKQALLTLIIGAPLLLAILWLMAAMGSHWWLYTWLLWAGFNLLLLFIYPLWIAPLFNRFTPLENANLKSRIEALLARCGFQSKGLFVMDGSRRSAHGNAYFTGFGRARRIVFFDTLLAKLEHAEIEAVLAHELGHFHHRHILQRIALSFTLSLAFLWLLALLMQQAWFFAGLGVGTGAGSTAMALILFFLVLPCFTFPFAPLSSLLSRRQEYEADAYAAHHTASEALTSALSKLYADNAATLTPDPWHSAFYDSHPPAMLRIARLDQLAAGRPA